MILNVFHFFFLLYIEIQLVVSILYPDSLLDSLCIKYHFFLFFHVFLAFYQWLAPSAWVCIAILVTSWYQGSFQCSILRPEGALPRFESTSDLRNHTQAGPDSTRLLFPMSHPPHKFLHPSCICSPSPFIPLYLHLFLFFGVNRFFLFSPYPVPLLIISF